MLTWMVFGDEPTACIFGMKNAIREGKNKVFDSGMKHSECWVPKESVIMPIVDWNAKYCRNIEVFSTVTP